MPVPDWEIVPDATADNPDENGRRKGAKIVGAIHLKDYVPFVKRCTPTWGKKFGYVKKDRVGFFGSLTIEEAKLCLCTEDFGWKLGGDAHLAPTPPYVRLCYGEHHGEQESIRIFTGLSEVHLLKDLDLREVHYMLQGLGYVSYNVPMWEEDRWWGEGIDVYPQRVSAGLAGGKGPMFYSWYYRLPPWMPGLCLEGEDGDYMNGPLALKKKQLDEHKEMERVRRADYFDESRRRRGRRADSPRRRVVAATPRLRRRLFRRDRRAPQVPEAQRGPHARAQAKGAGAARGLALGRRRGRRGGREGVGVRMPSRRRLGSPSR